MKLGDFFTSAPHARPVNPKPISITAVAKGDVMPGGARNPHKRPVAARVSGAFIFMAGDGAEDARAAARTHCRDKNAGASIEDDDFYAELTYQIISRVVREWDEETQAAGPPLFPSVDSLRELVVPKEANRVLQAYNAYVDEEHPEVVDDATFRSTQDGSSKLAAGRAR